MRLFFSSLPPGGPDGSGWPLNQALIAKEIEAVMARVTGVDYVNSLEMGVNGFNAVTEFTISGLQLPRLAGVSVAQGSAVPLATVFAPAGTTPSLNQNVPIPVSKSTC